MADFARPETPPETPVSHESDHALGERLAGETHSAGTADRQRAAATKRLVDQRVLPWLDAYSSNDSADAHADRAAVDQFPQLKNAGVMARDLEDVIVHADKNHDGLSKGELTDFIKGGQQNETTAAAGIALNHWNTLASPVGWFSERINNASVEQLSAYGADQALVDKHPELRNPQVLFAAVDRTFDTLSSLSGNRGTIDRPGLQEFIAKNMGSEEERAAAAMTVLSFNSLFGSDTWAFNRDNLTKLKAACDPNLESDLNRALSLTAQYQTSEVGSAAVGAAVGYTISKAMGSDHPGGAAVVGGALSSLVTAYENGAPERQANELRAQRHELDRAAIFDIPPLEE